jgi:hypothetical protein
MGNETTAGTMASAAPFGLIFEGVIKYAFPDFAGTLPSGTFAAAFMAAIAYASPPVGELWRRALDSM